MVAWKIAPALAAGNTVVLKPAEFTPLTALCLAEIAHEAGLPAGVLNVVTGDSRTGELMVNHPDIDKIAFTGSTEVGRIIRKATAGSGKKLSLELGGKSPFIGFDDAEWDKGLGERARAVRMPVQRQRRCEGREVQCDDDRVAGRLLTRAHGTAEATGGELGKPFFHAIGGHRGAGPEPLLAVGAREANS